MRVAVIILSLFGGLVMVDHAVIPMRLIMLISSSERSDTAVGSVALFTLWAVAAALVYAYPGVAWWLFALAGGVGIYTHDFGNRIDEFLLWGSVAVMLAALTILATREKRVADRIAWTRAQHELAVHAALRSLHQAVPELLAHLPYTDDRDPRPSGLVDLRPASPVSRETARR